MSSSFGSHVIKMLGFQKVYLIEEIMERDVESCRSDQNEKILVVFWNQSEFFLAFFHEKKQKKLTHFGFKKTNDFLNGITPKNIKFL